jgi:hypothetical protein
MSQAEAEHALRARRSEKVSDEVLELAVAALYGRMPEPSSTAAREALELLASTPSSECAHASRRLAQLPLVARGAGSIQPVELAASRWAESQDDSVVDALLRMRHSEVRTDAEAAMCLAHELVMLGRPCALAPDAIARTWPSHPLASVPLRKFEIESETSDRLSEGRAIASGRTLSYARSTELHEPGVLRDLEGPFRKWSGSRSGRVFRLEGGAGDLPLASDLRALLRDTRLVVRVAPEHAMARLYHAAVYGGTYAGRQSRAYSRVAAWRALAALVGEPADPLDPELLELAAGETLFARLELEVPAYWLGCQLLAVSPARDRLAIVIAEDSD